MKPISILVSIVLGVASLGVVVWLGQYKGAGVLTSPAKEAAKKEAPKAEDLALPKSGPFGKVEIGQTSFDFGSKMVGEKDKHTFTIKNVGEGSLEIKLGKPSCQCTVGEITKMDGEVIKQGPFAPGEEVSLSPGETVNINVDWVMKAETAKFRQHVPVFTTDPDRRDIELEIVGVVDGAVHILPGSVWDLGELSQTEPTKAVGVVYSAVFQEFSISVPAQDDLPVSVSWEPADSDFLESKSAKSGYQVTVEVKPGVPIGQFRQALVLHCDTPRPAKMIEDDEEKHDHQDKAADKPEGGDKAVAEGAEKPAAEGDAGEKKSGRLEFDLNFSVTGHRAGPIEIRGQNFSMASNRVVFGEFKAAEGKKAKLTLFPRGLTEELAVTAIEPADSRYRVKLEPGKAFGNAKPYVLEIEILPGAPVRHRDEKADVLILKLNHPDAPDLRFLIDYNAKD